VAGYTGAPFEIPVQRNAVIRIKLLAVVEAATSRFRPIMLTAISTVLGLIPIAPTICWGPMAYAIMGACWSRRC